MNPPVSEIISAFALDRGLKIQLCPFHGAEGLELRKKRGAEIVCVGYIISPKETIVYRRILDGWYEFFRTKLWFIGDWSKKWRRSDGQYEVLLTTESLAFGEGSFLEIAKREFSTA
jgi:hypothetical protein